MKIHNAHLKGGEATTAWGKVSFDANGCAEVSEEAAGVLLTVPGFIACGCIVKEEPVVAKASKKAKKEEPKVAE